MPHHLFVACIKPISDVVHKVLYLRIDPYPPGHYRGSQAAELNQDYR